MWIAKIVLVLEIVTKFLFFYVIGTVNTLTVVGPWWS